MIRVCLAASVLGATLTACTATTSFAPPPVAVYYANENGVGGACPQTGIRQTAITVTRDVPGAYRLVDAFIETYRCSAHSVANGRQALEIPAFLATTGAAAATALGGGATYGIVGTVANAAFTAGNKYWDPKLKAGIYDHALDALLCIKTEAVGIPAYKFDNAANAGGTPNAAGFSDQPRHSIVTVTADKQYFEMVSAAAFSVERITSQRLSTMAPVDAGAVSAELQKAIEAANAKEAERKAAKSAKPGTNTAGFAEPGREAEGTPEQQSIRLDLEVLKPKLDECVLRAKL